MEEVLTANTYLTFGALAIILVGIFVLYKEIKNFLVVANLSIVCDPMDADVYLDGNFMGKLSEKISVEHGNHKLKLIKTMEDGSYYYYENKLQFRKGEHKVLNIILQRVYTEKYYWNKAVTSNTKEDYDVYISKYPRGEFIVEAKSKLEDQYYEDSKTSIEASEEYMIKYPSGEYFSKVKDQIEELYFKKCITVSGCKVYIEKYPEGKHINDSEIRRAKEILSTINYKLFRTLKGHNGAVFSLSIAGNIIISGSDDKKIRKWDMQTGMFLDFFEGHLQSVSSVTSYDDKIISASDDKKIRIWDITTGEQVIDIEAHADWISSVKAYNGKIVSGSKDKTIKIWDIDDGRLLQILEGHSAGISSLELVNNKIVSGASNGVINVWNVAEGFLINTLEAHSDNVASLATNGRVLISGSWDDTIKVWNANSFELLITIKGDSLRVYSVQVSDNKIIAGCWDGTIKIWDLLTGELLSVINAHTGTIYSMVVVDDKVVTGSFDKLIKIWKLMKLPTQQPVDFSSTSSLKIQRPTINLNKTSSLKRET